MKELHVVNLLVLNHAILNAALWIALLIHGVNGALVLHSVAVELKLIPVVFLLTLLAVEVVALQLLRLGIATLRLALLVAVRVIGRPIFRAGRHIRPKCLMSLLVFLSSTRT